MDSTPTRRLGSSALQYISKLESVFISTYSICTNQTFAHQGPQCASDWGKHIWGQESIASNPCGCEKPVLGWRWKRHKAETQ